MKLATIRLGLIPALLSASLLYLSCTDKTAEKRVITVKNPLAIERSLETVEFDLGKFQMDNTDNLANTLGIVDVETKKEMTSQTVDTDGDGILDILLFQPQIGASAERSYEIIVTNKQPKQEAVPLCYSRFVPERTDDYAWENNRVAFRTYGPTAQKMVENRVKGGTLSSGIDAWLKRVDYPIIDKWYKKELETDGSYHEDTGEGLDNFHVGPSRGVGGIAVKIDTSYYISRNFVTWKTITTGPLRTSFELTYADWDAQGQKISEKKRISLDYGSNLSKFEIHLKGTDTVSAGLTLHQKEGEIGTNPEEGWVSYWEPHEGSELGTGIVVPKEKMLGYDHYVTDEKDKSNLFANINLNKKSIAVYYAGFGWKKSGQFSTKESWEKYLSQFSEKVNNPLVVTVK